MLALNITQPHRRVHLRKIASAMHAGPERKRFIFRKDSQEEYLAGEEDAK